MIEVRLTEGCINDSISWEGTLTAKELLIQYIHSINDEEAYDVLDTIVNYYGTYESLGTCEQCGDSFGVTTLNIKDIND